jgi:hypothetical protein
MPPKNDKNAARGKLRIGDDWNAIRIIALSQGNPLNAIAEFVENSIDARAKTITITRGREHGEHYLSHGGAVVVRRGEAQGGRLRYAAPEQPQTARCLFRRNSCRELRGLLAELALR